MTSVMLNEFFRSVQDRQVLNGRGEALSDTRYVRNKIIVTDEKTNVI